MFNDDRIARLERSLHDLREEVSGERKSYWKLLSMMDQLAEELGKKFVERPAMTVLVDIVKDKNV